MTGTRALTRRRGQFLRGLKPRLRRSRADLLAERGDLDELRAQGAVPPAGGDTTAGTETATTRLAVDPAADAGTGPAPGLWAQTHALRALADFHAEPVVVAFQVDQRAERARAAHQPAAPGEPSSCVPGRPSMIARSR